VNVDAPDKLNAYNRDVRPKRYEINYRRTKTLKYEGLECS